MKTLEDITIIQTITGLVPGLLLGYYFSYLKEKAKNKALLSDIGKLTKEKEEITSVYELEIAKRKYQYESKKEQYFKYFNLLDELSTKTNKSVLEKFVPALTHFYTEFLNANSDKLKEIDATTKLTNAVQVLVFEGNQDYLRFKNETSSIRLIAGNGVMQLVEEIDASYKLSLDRVQVMMDEMTNSILEGEMENLINMNEEITTISNHIQNSHIALMHYVRRELDEI